MLTPNHPSPAASFSQTEGPVGPELRYAVAHGTVGDICYFLSLVVRPPEQNTAFLLYHTVFLINHVTEL